MSIYRTLRRDIGAEFHVSRNLGENRLTKIRRAAWAVVYLAKAIRIAVSSMWREQIGSTVIYQGQRCHISNWAGSCHPTVCGPNGLYKLYVPREELTSVVTANELWHRFNVGFDWYMGFWFDLDINRRLYPESFAIRPE